MMRGFSRVIPRCGATVLVPAIVLTLTAPGCDVERHRPTRYSGTIEAVEVDVAPEITGRILRRPVDQGDALQVGDLVAEIDPEPYRMAQAATEAALAEARANLTLLTAGYREEEIRQAASAVAEARAQLDLAHRQEKRVADLVSDHVSAEEQADIARRDVAVAEAQVAAAVARHDQLTRGYRPEEIDQARSEVARLSAELDQRRLDLQRTHVVSPLDGTVTEKVQEAGEIAAPGSPIVTVADLTNLYTWVYLSTLELPEVRLGDEAAVLLDAFSDREFPGKVVYISPEAEFTPKNVQTVDDRVQLVFGVKVAVPNPDGVLKAGLPADVVFRPAGAP